MKNKGHFQNSGIFQEFCVRNWGQQLNIFLYFTTSQKQKKTKKNPLLSWHTCKQACLVVSNSLWPHGLQHTRLLCPWNFPGKNTRVVSISYFRGSFQPRDQTLSPALPGGSFTTKPYSLYQHYGILPGCFVNFEYYVYISITNILC